MKYQLLIILLFILYATAMAQHKTLNTFVDYANQSAEEVTAVVNAIQSYYPTINQKRSWGAPRFTCPVQLDEYYYNKAMADAKGLSIPALEPFKKLREIAEAIDSKCKALDTYHKLEDYKQDEFKKAYEIINEINELLSTYAAQQLQLSNAIRKSISSNTTPLAYVKAEALLYKNIERERQFIETFRFNLKEEIHTGLDRKRLEQSIADTDAAVRELKALKVDLKYPASSMLPSFTEGVASMLEQKRHALDHYNHEAKKSDKHINDTYRALINYFNGTLIAFYNSFIGYARNDGYAGVTAIKYVPVLEIRTGLKTEALRVTPYEELTTPPLTLTKQNVSISKDVFSALSRYVDFINETYRAVRHQRDVIRNFNSSAASYKDLESYAGKGKLYFEHKGFVIPYSYAMQALSESKSIKSEYASILNKQVGELIGILIEMDALGATLENETKDKKYEKDKLAYSYEILERYKVLFRDWDVKKEKLYLNVRDVFDSYTPSDAKNSWYVSSKALRELTQYDYDALKSAKLYYEGSGASAISTVKIDEALRSVIANEYTNLNGIQKLGRNHGLCPYTPYEDIPKTSKTFSESLKSIKPANPDNYSYQHPYHSLVYLYNEVVDDYNKFASLSPVPVLQNVKQPELFDVLYAGKSNKPTVASTPQNIPTREEKNTTPDAAPKANSDQPHRPENGTSNEIVVKRDTIYIERRDTVYIHSAIDNLRSMEGYAINNMVLLLDVSGSMNAPDKLPLLKKAVLDLLTMMRKEDEVSIVVFSGKPKVLLSPSSFVDDKKIQAAIESLKPSGKTDANAGIKLAYKVADGNYKRGGNNRIILATDGEFSLQDDTRTLIEKFSNDDIFLSVFNFGIGAGAAKNLEAVSKIGKGNYAHITKENVDIKLIQEAKAKRKK